MRNKFIQPESLSSASHSPKLLNPEQKKVIALCSLGGALEFYDFVIFALLAKVIGEIFFPQHNAIISLLETFAIFAIGYLMRPIGGIVFSHIGDKRGRKNIFVITLLLMAIPTFLIGLLPGYQTIGILAPILLIILRLLQGFSVGGEIPGAIVFISETLPEGGRGQATAWVIFGVNMGLLGGSLLVTLFTQLLSPEQLSLWGWRLLFCFGGLLGFISYYLRKKLNETHLFQYLEKHMKQEKFPLKTLFKSYLKTLIPLILIVGLQASLISVIYLFLPSYLSLFFHVSTEKAMQINTLGIAIISILLPLMGKLSDNYGRKKILCIGILLLLLVSYPLFLLLHPPLEIRLVLFIALFSLLGSFIAGCFSGILGENFPTSVRYTGTALAYNLGFGIIGGLSPLFSTYLIHVTKNIFAPAFCLMGIAFFSLIALIFVKETAHKNLNHLP